MRDAECLHWSKKKLVSFLQEKSAGGIKHKVNDL